LYTSQAAALMTRCNGATLVIVMKTR